MDAAETAKERVARGARMLDEWRPTWFAIVDTDRLDTSSPLRCVAGQQPEGFSGVMRELGLSERYPSITSAGFDGRADDYGELDKAWRDAIATRRQIRNANAMTVRWQVIAEWPVSVIADGLPVGTFETAELAAHVVELHNRTLGDGQTVEEE